MSAFTDALNARRVAIGLSVQDITEALQLRGIPAAYPTVAGWFNGGRGERWEPETLHAVLELLQTDLGTLLSKHAGRAPDFSDPIYSATSRAIAELTPAQQAAVLALIKSFG